MPRLLIRALPLLLLVPLGLAHAQPLSTARLALKVDSAARALVASKAVPSVSIAISRNGRTVYAKAFGTADLEQGIAATPSSVYLIGSITKQFTAAAVMALVEDGKLTLDDTLGRFFPSWPAAGRGVTVRQLLNHTSGIKDYTGVPRWLSLMALPLSQDSMVALFRDAPLDFAPGTAWLYDNSGYYLLGMIIERVSGMKYADFLKQRLLAKANLTAIDYCDSRLIVPRRIPGYNAAAGGFTNAAPIFVDQAFAAGALCGTAEALVAWSRALHGGRVVSPASYTQMITPLPLPGGKPQQYGFGLGASTFGGHRVISHNGGINGFRSQMADYLDDSLVVAVLVNAETGDADKLERHITRWALGIPEEVIKDLPLTASELARLAGKYVMGETAVELKVEGDHLMASGLSAPTKLLHQGGGDYRFAANPEIKVSFMGSGAKAEAMVLMVSGATLTLTRVP